MNLLVGFLIGNNMRLSKKEQKMKQYIKAKKRLEELSNMISKTPLEKLDKKIFVGHWRYFGVRADVLRSSIGEDIQTIVDICNHWVLGKKKDESTYNCNTPYYTQFGLNNGQYLESLSEEKFLEYNFSSRIKKWFIVREYVWKLGTKNFTVKRYFPNIPKHMLEWRYKPAYITAVKTKVGDWESEYFRLREFMDRENVWSKIYGNHKDDWSLSLSKKKEINKLKEKEIRDFKSGKYEDC